MMSHKGLRFAQQNLHHDYNATISAFNHAIESGIDLFLMQDPYVHKIGDKYNVPSVSQNVRIVADFHCKFKTCIAIFNTSIDVLKIKGQCSSLITSAVIELH